MLSAAIASTAQADSPSTSDRPTSPPRLLGATPEAELPFDSPRAVEVMSARALADQQRSTVAEALLESEGAHPAWSAPSVLTVNLRGLGTPRVLVLQNGVRLNPGSSGPTATPLGDLDPFLVDQLEIVRGPGSVLWGSDAMGGVINVVTQRPRFDPRRAWDIGADARLRFDSASSGLVGHAAATGHLRRLGLRAGFTARRLDDLLGGRDTGRQRYTSYWQANADIAARLDLGPAGLVDLDYTRGERHDAYFPSTAGDAAFSRVRDHARDVVALNYAGKFPRVFLHGVELTLSAQSLRTLRDGFRPEANRIDR